MTQQGDRYDYEPGAIIPGHVYRVVQPLGQGGMGTVYLVEDTTIGKHYALKTINREFADRIDMAARMRKEARALVSLRHPNIVDVITLGQTGDELKLVFILMEYLEGSTLKAILRGDQRKGRLELRHVLDIAIDVSDALEKAHAEGFVHRDIKPDNIFLVVALEGTRAKAVVLDFGIIGLHDKEAAEDRGQFMGTPRYGAPEQVRGGRCVSQSDLYSLAVVMFETIAGHGPFPGVKGPVNLADAHLNQPAPRLSKFVPDVNRDLDNLLYAALQKEPSARAIVDKASGRRVPLTATSLGSELRRIRREEAARQPQHVDENKTLETLLGVMHAGAAPESTIDDPVVGERIAAAARGRSTTLVGLSPVDQGLRREGEQSGGSGQSPPAQTPIVSGSRHVFPPRPEVSPAPPSPRPEELLSQLGGRGGLGQGRVAVGARHGAQSPGLPPSAAPPMVAPFGSLRGVPATTEPIPPPLAERGAARARDASPAPGAPDSWRRVQAAMALAEQGAAVGVHRADEMDAAKARVPLVGPAAGRLRAPTPAIEPSVPRPREITDASASRTVDPQAFPVPARRGLRAPLIITLVVLGASLIVLLCAAVVAASRSWSASSSVVPTVPAASASAVSSPLEPTTEPPAASLGPTVPPSVTGPEASSGAAPSAPPAAHPPRVAPQPARLTTRPPSSVSTAPLGSSKTLDVGDPFKTKMQ
jgi:serine/threonine-protein kinase